MDNEGVFEADSDTDMDKPTANDQKKNTTEPKVKPTDPKASAHGIRWSALMRLPYFDIVRFVVIDGMHNLFLGLIKDHFRQILGLDHAGLIVREEESRGRASAVPKETVLDISWPGTSYLMLPEKVQTDVRYLRKLLQGPLNEALTDPEERLQVLERVQAKLKDALKSVCDDLEIDASLFTPGSTITKKAYATALLAWVSFRFVFSSFFIKIFHSVVNKWKM